MLSALDFVANEIPYHSTANPLRYHHQTPRGRLTVPITGILLFRPLCTPAHTLIMATDRHSKSGGQGQGMNWITPHKRLAIYLRDGLACCYCGQAIEDGVKLTLDHLRPHTSGGANSETNLVTCCHACNSSRGSRSWKLFAAKVADYINHGVTAEHIVDHINAVRVRKLDVSLAKSMIAARGGFSAALRSARD